MNSLPVASFLKRSALVDVWPWVVSLSESYAFPLYDDYIKTTYGYYKN